MEFFVTTSHYITECNAIFWTSHTAVLMAKTPYGKHTYWECLRMRSAKKQIRTYNVEVGGRWRQLCNRETSPFVDEVWSFHGGENYNSTEDSCLLEYYARWQQLPSFWTVLTPPLMGSSSQLFLGLLGPEGIIDALASFYQRGLQNSTK